MPQRVFRNSLILLTISLYVGIIVQGDNNNSKQLQDNSIDNLPNDANYSETSSLRTKRAVKKPGFFLTLFSVIGEQYTDTKDTISKVNNMINDNFLPENAPVTEATTPKDPNATTTMAPYKITRSEFNRIIRRNLKGLARLFNIEFRDALKQSEKTRAEYNRNVSKEISKFL